MQQESPYEYYDNKIGVRIKFLISDRDKLDNSFCFLKYNALYKRMRSGTCIEKELRRASLGCDALILFSSLQQDWKDAITTRFGHPKEEIKKAGFLNITFQIEKPLIFIMHIPMVVIKN